jgi:hypothetical protein
MKTLVAKWAGKCAGCGAAFAAGETVAWRGTSDTWHVACHEADLEKTREEDREQSARHAAQMAAFKAGAGRGGVGRPRDEELHTSHVARGVIFSWTPRGASLHPQSFTNASLDTLDKLVHHA